MKNIYPALHHVVALAIILSISLLLSAHAQASGHSYYKWRHKHANTTRVDGFVSHGVNVYNDEYLVDYSNASPNIPFLMPVPPLYEIGVLDPGAADSEVINAQTDQSRLVATNSRFVQLFGIPLQPELFNRTLDQVPSTFFGSTSILDRVLPLPFGQAGEATIYRRTKTNHGPSLQEWNKVSGRISFTCHSDDSATLRLSVANAFPNAIYTMWDVGALNPLTAQEAPYAVPLGGLPNTLITDDNGCASTKLDIPYCPGRPCEAGAASCSSYLSLAHHWDQQTYGAGPVGSFFGLPVGAFGGNHIVWPMSGTALQDPPNPWNPRTVRRTCR